MTSPHPWTKAEFEEFDRLTAAASEVGFDNSDRVIARIELKKFVDRVGKAKCDAMFVNLNLKERAK